VGCAKTAASAYANEFWAIKKASTHGRLATRLPRQTVIPKLLSPSIIAQKAVAAHVKFRAKALFSRVLS
jgi:hypothetical protein